MESSHNINAYARKDLDRLISFSDGVYAVAITLLALNFKLPDLASQYSSGTFEAEVLRQNLPALAGYIVSFVVVGMYWIAHHRIVRYIVRLDSRLLWYNIFLLLFVGLIPYSTQLVAMHGNEPFSDAVYASIQALIGITQFLIWHHAASQKRLIDSELTENTIAVLRIRTAVAPGIFLISIPLAYVHPALAPAMWLVLFFFRTAILSLFPAFRAGKNNPELVKW